MGGKRRNRRRRGGKRFQVKRVVKKEKLVEFVKNIFAPPPMYHNATRNFTAQLEQISIDQVV